MKAQSRYRNSCSLFFLIDSSKIPHCFIGIKDMPKTAFSVPFSSTLKETTLSEQRV